MKNKTVAGILALMGGYAGIHRFYLGQVGLGMAYIFLLPVFMIMGLWAIPFIIGFVDAAKMLSMDQEEFDNKYNSKREGQSRWQNNRRREDKYAPGPRGKAQQRREERRNRSADRQPSSSRRKPDSKWLKKGIEQFKEYDFDEALKFFEKALAQDPKNAAVHFNLACTHSLLEHKDKGFYHLDRAVDLGLNDFEILKTRDHLAYLRIQPEWEQFAANGFRLVEQIKSEPKQQADNLNSEPATPQPETGQPDVLQQLQQLAEFKEKGLLTEAEFQAQKEKLLR